MDMSGPTIQTGIGLSEKNLLRLDRLRAVYGHSRSKLINEALSSGGLIRLELDRKDDIARFDDLARAAGLTWEEGARVYAERYGRMTWPPTIDQAGEKLFSGEKLRGRRVRVSEAA